MTDWRTTNLAELGRIVTGKTPVTSDLGNYGGEVPFVTPTDMDGRRSIQRTLRYLTEAGAASVASSRLAEPSVAVSCIGSDMGKAVLLPAGSVTNQQINAILVNKDNDRLFVYYNLYGRRAEIRDRAGGAAQPILNKTDFGRLPILLPTHDEQIRISSVLGALDDKIDANRRMGETLDTLARAIFKDWFVSFRPVHAKMQGCDPSGITSEIAALFPDRLAEDGLPEGWTKRRVGDFAELVGGKQLSKENIADVGPVPVFGGAGLMGYTTKHNADGFVISVGRVGAYCGQFFSHRGKAWINNNASLIRQKTTMPGEWLIQALRHADIAIIKKGAAQPFVSNFDIANLPLIWPGQNLLSASTELLTSFAHKAEQIEAESHILAALRDLLLPKLMSGTLLVKEAEKQVEQAA